MSNDITLAVAVESTPMEVALPSTVDGWLVRADTLGGSMYAAVREAALLAAHEPVEFEAGETITADKRAKAIRAKHEDTLSKLSVANRGNIRNWFANFLVVQFTPAGTMLEIAAPKGDQGAVSVKAEDAVKLSKNDLAKAAKHARALEGTGGNNAGKTLNSAGGEVKTSTEQPAEVAAEVAMFALLDKMIASFDGLNRVQAHLSKLGFVLVTKPEQDVEAEQAEAEAEQAEADKAAQRAKRSRK